MFAIVEVASRQYKLTEGDTVYIPGQYKDKKEMVLDKVLMTISGKDVNIGLPYIKDAKVVCDVIGCGKGEKVVAFKFKKRKRYKRKVGFRERQTLLKVKEIITSK